MLAERLKAGQEPAEMMAIYPHVSPAALYDAISYYLDHQDEIDRFLEETTLEALAKKYNFTIGPDGRLAFKRP